MEIKDLVAKFEKAVGTIEAQAVENETLKSDVAVLTGKIDTLTSITAVSRGIVENVRGNKVRWESADTAKNFMKFVKALAEKDMVTVKAMNENNAGTGSEADGGQLVPVEFKPTLLQIMADAGVIRSAATVLPMVRDEIMWPVYNREWKDANGAVTTPAYWVDENTAGTQTWPQFTNVTLIAKKLMAIVPASNELLQDSTIPIASLIAQMVGEFYAEEEDRVGFVGKIASGDKFDGVLTAAGKTVTGADSDLASAASAVTLAKNLLDMPAQLAKSSTNGAKYYMHRSVFDIIRSLATATEKIPLYNPIAEGGPRTIYGYPVELVEAMPAYTGDAASTRFILFGNMKNYYMGDKMQMNVAASDIAGYLSFQTLFRFVERIGFKLPLANNFCAMKTSA